MQRDPPGDMCKIALMDRVGTQCFRNARDRNEFAPACRSGCQDNDLLDIDLIEAEMRHKRCQSSLGSIQPSAPS